MHHLACRRLLALAALVVLGACADTVVTTGPSLRGNATAALPPVINEVHADPAAVGDDVGEWIEVHNPGASSVSLQGWRIVSGNDAAHTIATAVVVPAGGYVVLARNGTKSKNGGVTAAYAYGTGITLGNAADWVALRDASGATVDSVAWSGAASGTARGVRDPSLDNADAMGTNWQLQATLFGKGDRGTPGARNDGYQAPATQPVVTTVTVTPATASLAPGATQQLAASATDQDGQPIATTYTWTTSAPAVATVSTSGLVTAVAAGTATITATAPNGVAGSAAVTVTSGSPPPTGSTSELVVQVLDVGQGDATLITNGTSRVLVDGGPSQLRMGAILDSLGLNNTTIDVVVLSHEHADHLSGLRELFETARNITVRYFFENKNVYSSVSLAELRDSVIARANRGQLQYRDTDDPCGDGRAICTIAMAGGAKLHVMRPHPTGSSANDRSTPLKLVGPDSASFTMWMAGDAEHAAIDWFDTGANYDVSPGMKVNVLKADHHGSCNGVRRRYLDLLAPDWVTFSVGTSNSYGHVHTQTKELFGAYGTPWYRTDENGTITFRSPGTPGGGYTVAVKKGVSSMAGAPDGTSAATACSTL